MWYIVQQPAQLSNVTGPVTNDDHTMPGLMGSAGNLCGAHVAGSVVHYERLIHGMIVKLCSNAITRYVGHDNHTLS